jgi:glycosyltransferase involved in cell wall biosynthesis
MKTITRKARRASSPKVSVLVPTYNYEQYLPMAVESVLGQSYADFEVVLIEDCSTDGSRELAEKYYRLDDRVTLVLHHVNSGLSCARNSGLIAATGEFIAMCDADDIWLSHKLQVQMDRFKETPGVGVVHSDSAIIDREGKLTGQRFSDLMHRTGQVTSGNLFEELCERNFMCVPTVIMRRETMEYAGGFDASLRSLEDWVCWAKSSRRYLFSYIEEPLVQYRVHGASLSHDPIGMAKNRVKAIHILLEAFRDMPSPIRARMLYNLGVSHLEISDARGAVAAFTESIQTYPAQLRSWVRAGQALLSLAKAHRT